VILARPRKEPSGQNVSIYLSKKAQQYVERARKMLMENDRLVYGDEFVEKELRKTKNGRYTMSHIINMLIEYGFDVFKNNINEVYQREKQKKQGLDNPVIRMLLEEEMKRRMFKAMFDIW